MSILYGCPCGAGQHDTQFPQHNKVHIITDEDLDTITDYGKEIISRDHFDEHKREGYFCWQCGRFLIHGADKVRAFEEVGVRYKIYSGPNR